MLPAAHRLTDAASFREVTRRGRRVSSPRLVTHLLVETDPGLRRPARIGFVVGKAVGNSVVRSRVQRRLRHAAIRHLDDLPVSAVLVVRALPSAAAASYGELADDLASCLTRSGAAA